MIILKKYWPYIILSIVVAIGAFLRIFDLSALPGGIYPDEAKNANDALATLANNDWRVFYSENNGREGLFIWLVAFAFKFLGTSIFSFKIVSAVAGTLTIITTYLVTKEIFLFSTQDNGARSQVRFSFFAREISALLAAGFLATSFWHLNFSRISFRTILVPLFLSAAIYFTLRALRRKNLLDVVLAGTIWGAGAYTYIAFRFAFLVLAFIFITSAMVYFLQNKPNANWEWLKRLHVILWRPAAVGIIAILFMIPLLKYFLQNSGSFVSRSSGISVFDAQNPPVAFLKSLGAHLQMLFVNGDMNWRHNFSGEAQLLWPVALLFMAGVIYSFWIIYEAFKYRNYNMLSAHLILYAWFFVMILPAALTIEGVPNALHSIGLMPVVFIFSSFGFLLFIKWLFPDKHYRADFWPFGAGAALIVIFLLASFQFKHYFNDWGKKSEAQGAFAYDFTQIGNYFNTLETESVQKILIINESGVEVTYPHEVLMPGNEGGTLPMPAQTTLFIQQANKMPLAKTTYIRFKDLPIPLSGKTVFVPLRADNEIKNRLRTLYPTGSAKQFSAFWAYEIEI